MEMAERPKNGSRLEIGEALITQSRSLAFPGGAEYQPDVMAASAVVKRLLRPEGGGGWQFDTA